MWHNNEIQFARLICEIVANVEISREEFELLCDSMDLEKDYVDELFDRANDVWEEAKGNV